MIYSFEIYAKHFIYMGVLPRNTLSCVMSEKSPLAFFFLLITSDFNCLSIGYSQFIRRSLQSSWYKQVPTHCLSLFATSAEDLPDSVIFSFTMNYTKTTWFLQSTFINILHINPRVFHGVWPQCGQLKPRMLKIQRFWAYILDFLYKYLDISS